MLNIKDKAAIVGIGQTEFTATTQKDRLTLALEAITAAVDDAGLKIKDIDGIVKCSIDASASDDILSTNLGLKDVTFWAEVPHGGGGTSGTVYMAALAVATGQANNVICYRSFTPFDYADGAKHNASTIWARDSGAGDFLRVFGWGAMVNVFALCAQRHMYEYGTTTEQLGNIVKACRKHASMNPRAMRRGPFTLDDYLKSPYVSEPLREADCFIFPTIGACAVVVTSAERAKGLKQRPAYITAAAQCTGPNSVPWWEMWPLRKGAITECPSRYLAPRLYKMAGITPKDIDVAEIYDCYSYTLLVQLEDYGFCKKGEGGAFAEGGRLELGGELPVNTHGGHLGEAYIHGFSHILEGVRQVRGTSTAQVKDAELVLVTSGTPNSTSALIMRRK